VPKMSDNPFIAATNTNNEIHQFIQYHQQIRHRSNRSRRGLYDGKDIRTGNNVSFSNKKTKRKFKPNVFIKRIYSEVMDEMIRFHVTASALKSIDKHGGLDKYVLKSKHVVVDEGEGGRLKRRIMQKLEVHARRNELGGPANVSLNDLLGPVVWKNVDGSVKDVAPTDGQVQTG